MSKLSRDKGARGEREVVALALAAGLPAQRSWATAQSPDAATRACDVLVGALRCQVKLRKAGFGVLYGALANVDAAFVRADGKRWLAVLPAETLLAMLREETPDGLRAESAL